MEDFFRITQEIWRMYFKGTGSKDAADQLINKWIDPACTIIGTGKHEVYKTVESFREALYQESSEENELPFRFKDFWCQPVMLRNDLCLVYGEVYIYLESEAEMFQSIWIAAFRLYLSTGSLDGKCFIFIIRFLISSRLMTSIIPKRFCNSLI